MPRQIGTILMRLHFVANYQHYTAVALLTLLPMSNSFVWPWLSFLWEVSSLISTKLVLTVTRKG
ncbi:hypothetical protein BDV24DRAFT_129406 [Aspergillus arachidicola]|uniref:Uncharacterized protein n=1 Tax=Aspergillus arachidicola TaxID=656916 RepID=A0A5N6YE73_9EURO|nr:hypothetical protein BDV24DRAFT_129406 [Aspergillus arachidicola]